VGGARRSGRSRRGGYCTRRPDGPEVVAWLERAQEDLGVAELLAQSPEPFHGPVCFHCQQAAEKALKAALVLGGCVPPRTHDLAALLDALRAVPVPGELLDHAARLTGFAVTVRYPGLPGACGPAESLRALLAARARPRTSRLHVTLPRTGAAHALLQHRRPLRRSPALHGPAAAAPARRAAVRGAEPVFRGACPAAVGQDHLAVGLRAALAGGWPARRAAGLLRGRPDDGGRLRGDRGGAAFRHAQRRACEPSDPPAPCAPGPRPALSPSCCCWTRSTR
jgi:HEPN domain-containing protein